MPRKFDQDAQDRVVRLVEDLVVAFLQGMVNVLGRGEFIKFTQNLNNCGALFGVTSPKLRDAFVESHDR